MESSPITKKDKELPKEISKNKQIDIYRTMMNSEFIDNKIFDHNWEIKTNDLVSQSSVNQAKEEFEIPWEEKQKSINLADALGTYTHEFSKHVVSWYNTNKYLWKGFKWANYLETEEGLASVFTALWSWKVSSLSDLRKLLEKPSLWAITILIGEHYNLEDTLNIMNIYKKLIGSKINIEDVVYRRKRFIHHTLPWSSPKDMSYTRGKNQIIYFLQSLSSEEELLIAIHDLNTFKLNMKDRYILPELKKELWIQETDLMRSNFIGLYIAHKLGIALQWNNSEDIEFNVLTKNISHITQNHADDILQVLDKN